MSDVTTRIIAFVERNPEVAVEVATTPLDRAGEVLERQVRLAITYPRQSPGIEDVISAIDRRFYLLDRLAWSDIAAWCTRTFWPDDPLELPPLGPPLDPPPEGVRIAIEAGRRRASGP